MSMPESLDTPSYDPTSREAMDNVLAEHRIRGEQSEQRQYTEVEKEAIRHFLQQHEQEFDKIIGFYGDSGMKPSLECPSVSSPEHRSYVSAQEKHVDSNLARFSEGYRRGLIILANTENLLGENISLLMASKYDRYKNGTDVVGVARGEGESEGVLFGINSTHEEYKKNARNEAEVQYMPASSLAERRGSHLAHTAINAEVDLKVGEEARLILMASKVVEGKAEEIRGSSDFMDLRSRISAELSKKISESIKRLEKANDDDGIGDTVKSFNIAKIENLQRIEAALQPTRV